MVRNRDDEPECPIARPIPAAAIAARCASNAPPTLQWSPPATARSAPRRGLDPKSFQLRAGDENLKEYLFNKHAIHHQLCVDCGVDVFARGKKPDGSDVVALNVSCIDGIELSKLKMTPVDGRSM